MKRSLAAVLSTLLAGACTAGPAGEGEPVGPDAAIEDEDDVGGVPLSVDPPPPSTYWSSVPVSGRGPANGTLLYTTPGGGQFAKELGADGSFCVDVTLTRATSNYIGFEAIDVEGQYSDHVGVEIRQDGEPPDIDPDPEPQAGYVNIIRDSSEYAMSVSVEEGSIAGLVDGDTSGHVSLRNAATSVDWLAIDLTERAPIERIRIETTDDCPMDSYNVLLTDVDADHDPLRFDVISGWVYGDGWSVVAHVSEGTTRETIFPSISGPVARRMAIEFLSRDCGPFVGSGRHKITEIEVWGLAEGEEDPGPVDPTPSCATGG